MSKSQVQGKVKRPQEELADAFTGEVFSPKSRNHYEVNDGVPFAPAVELNRPSIRQRIENLLNRDPGVLQAFMGAQDDGSVDMDIPDDPEAPLTASEQNALDMMAADAAEQAPMPDEGLPRQEILPPLPEPLPSEGQPIAGEPPGGGGPPAASAPPKGASPEPLRRAPSRTGPTR